jgi:hypothetical protein
MTSGVETKDNPASDVLSTYSALATPIVPGTKLKRVLLSPQSNPFGPVNTDGVYLISTGGADLQLVEVRVVGTLVIDAGAGSVRIEDPILMEKYRADYPVLIVSGHLVVGFAGSMPLGEQGNMNFNPSGTPFQGSSDSDTTDDFLPRIEGLIHVTGNVTLDKSPIIYGALVAQGNVTVTGSPQITHDSTIWTQPPYKYTKTPVMTLLAGSTKQIVE